MKDTEYSPTNRRTFIKTTGAAAASGLAFPSVTFGKPDSRKLKIGFIGCGGRGTGAAGQALSADPGVTLWALGDAFADRLASSATNLENHAGDRAVVPAERRFVGFDAFKQVIDSDVDVVILTTPPGFRPLHIKAAVDAGAEAAGRVGELVAAHVIARPHDALIQNF